MSHQAPYRLTHINQETYLAIAPKISHWSQVPGWELETTVFDLMHNCFLGTSRDIIASSLRVMVEHGVFDSFGFNRKSDEMFAHITMEIHDTYKQHRQA